MLGWIKTRRSAFAKAAGLLAGSTAISQGLQILVLPVITRLYTPDDFSVLAAFSAILLLLSIGACLRLDMAIPIVKSDDEAINLLALALLFSGAISAAIGLVLLFFRTELFALAGGDSIAPFWWLLPLGVWLAACASLLQAWATRKKRFKTIAGTRITQTGTSLSSQLALGWYGTGPLGLIVGTICLSGAGSAAYLRQLLRLDMVLIRSVRPKAMLEALIRNRQYPLVSTLGAVVSTASVQVPILMIVSLAVGPEAGFVFLAIRVVAAPVNMIGSAVGQVYRSRATEEDLNNNLPSFTTDVLNGLFQFGIGPLVTICVVAPTLFALVFGSEWERAGYLVQWMTPWFALKLVGASVSAVMYVRSRQVLLLFITVAVFLIRGLGTLGAYFFNNEWIGEGFALSGAVALGVSVFVYLKVADLGRAHLLRLTKTLLLGASAGAALGMAVNFGLEMVFS